VTTFVDSAVKDIDDRLKQLKEEASRLEAARAALTGPRRRPGRPRGSRSATARPRTTRAVATRATRPRGRRGGNTRANQALELVRKRPGITIPQIAVAMKIQPNYLYRVMPRLQSDGQVKRDGQGWRLAS
jgi:hypothetical protein